MQTFEFLAKGRMRTAAQRCFQPRGWVGAAAISLEPAVATLGRPLPLVLLCNQAWVKTGRAKRQLPEGYGIDWHGPIETLWSCWRRHGVR